MKTRRSLVKNKFGNAVLKGFQNCTYLVSEENSKRNDQNEFLINQIDQGN